MPTPSPASRRSARTRTAPLTSLLCMSGPLLLLASTQAQAIPSFARQTGSSCADCHVGSYGPSLTPYGMRFKLGGFTDTDGNGTKIPASGQLTWSRRNPSRGDSTARLTQADLYLAGRVNDNIGGYSKIRSNNSGNATFTTQLDDVDLRFVSKPFQLAGKDAMLGVSVNNNPGISDPIHVLPNASTFTPASVSNASTMLSSSALSNRVIGASVYGLYDRNWYGEVGSYSALSVDAQDHLGWQPNGDPGKLSDTGYARLAYMKDMKRQFFSVGLSAMTTRRQRPRIGPSDEFTDLGYDLTYQFLGTREHVLSLAYVNIYERRRYGSPLLPSDPTLAPLSRGSVRDQTISMNYAFKQTYGVLAAHMMNTGSFDAARYLPYGLPDTTSNLILLYWTPFGKEGTYTTNANVRVSASWFRFDKFNGSTTNVFGGGNPITNPRDLDSFALSLNVSF
ncbi:cytochrome C [Xanthomonas melonis]|uniref:Cytochrome C n=1 Tax=Xanthomonas melonis TaxID=56456 RepID=A0ABS8NVQ4_9XANT|nr:cytochrome C [Xanthomonas melonis]MCD0246432.1 cytochrome C [Xanthomonas melonis]MCD0258863.1 cytochrome C [Xanthomonas melonis]MCD0267164.1 cytochrome C [Xanthomonas melonis]MCD0278179.1 cytochrome C [Xanthomonas melonis]